MTDWSEGSTIKRARSSYDLVLGSALGAYLGITVSREGLGGDETIDFAVFLLCACGFVMGLNNALQMVQRGNWRVAGVWTAILMVSFLVLFQKSANFGLNLDVLVAIAAVWVVVACGDAAASIVTRRIEKAAVAERLSESSDA